MITADQLIKLGVPRVIADLWVKPLQRTFAAFSIDTKDRACAFLAQALHETNHFRALRENMNYTTADAMRRVWPNRFTSNESCIPYFRQPEKLANYVYARRGGNGPTSSGDGWRYRGGGVFHHTFKEAYAFLDRALERLMTEAGVDLIGHPEQIIVPEVACMAAGVYWESRHLSALADHQPDDNDLADFTEITRVINPPLAGLQSRLQLWSMCQEVL